jgi:hypothetical protein
MSKYEFAESPEEINLLINKFLELKPFDTVLLNYCDQLIGGKHDYSDECIVDNINDIQKWESAELSICNLPTLKLFRYDSWEDKQNCENYRYLSVQDMI